jgi:hypothetical protein
LKRSFALLVAAAAAATALVGPAPGAQALTATVAYDATRATPLPGNVASVGLQATQASELGDEITLADGTPRTLGAVTVTMSSWACQRGAWNTSDCSSDAGARFNIPITLTIYRQSKPGPNNTVVPGKVIAKATKFFAIPYRPSANFQKCFGANAGKWWAKNDGPTGKCYNGRAANIVFNFGSLGLTVPSTVVVGVSYDTTNYGYDPLGNAAPCVTADGGCPYDALNIGTEGDAPTVGTKPNPDTAFYNTANAGQRCDSDAAATNQFTLDSPTNACWAGFIPNIRVTTLS